MKALVLGGTGFIGMAACKELMRRGVETIAASRREHPYGTFTSHIAFDRRDRDELARALQEVQPDVLLDLACYQPEQIREVVELFRGERYVFMSSAAVYASQDFQGRPAAETDFTALEGEPAPGLDYIAGKQWCETVLRRNPTFPSLSLRAPYVMGAGDPTRRIAAYIQRLADGGPVLVPAETWERAADLVWVRDAGFACALACELRHEVRAGDAFNVAFTGVSLSQLLQAMAAALAIAPRFAPVPFADIPAPARPYGPDPREPAGMVIEKAQRELGFEPSALEDAIAETLAWYRVARPSHPGYETRPAELELAKAMLT